MNKNFLSVYVVYFFQILLLFSNTQCSFTLDNIKKNNKKTAIKLKYKSIKEFFIEKDTITITPYTEEDKIIETNLTKINFDKELDGSILFGNKKNTNKNIPVIYKDGSLEYFLESNTIPSYITIDYKLLNPKEKISEKKTKIIYTSPLKNKNEEIEKNNEQYVQNEITEKEIEVNKEVIKEIEEKKTSSFIEKTVQYAKNKHPFLIALITFFLGILMSLTPCIYPMIPITIGVLGIDRQPFLKRLQSGFLYITGISITFSIIGLLTATGKMVFGQLFSTQLFTILFTFILIFMTLNMLNMTGPLTSINGINYLPESLKNHRYLPLFYGILSGTITSPCASPGLIAVLSLISQQESLFIGWIWLFTFGLGLSSLLFLISLAMNSNLIFPKAASWMEDLKEILGVILCLLIYINTSQFFGNTIGFVLVMVILAVFLLHKYSTFSYTPKSKKYWFFSFSVIFAFLTVLFLLNDFLKKNNNNINDSAKINSIEILWYTNIKEAQKKAKDENKLLLIDITADWCSICSTVDKEIFKNLSIMQNLKNLCIFCKIDCTQLNEEKKEILSKYNVDGFPSIILINPESGKILNSLHGEILGLSEKNELLPIILETHSSIKE